MLSLGRDGVMIPIVTLSKYLRSRTSKMDYRTYRHFRLPIGSGVTEAARKIVFTQRFKLSKMKSTIEGGRGILMLCVIALSRVWTQVRGRAFDNLPLPIPVTPTPHDAESIENSQILAV